MLKIWSSEENGKKSVNVNFRGKLSIKSFLASLTGLGKLTSFLYVGYFVMKVMNVSQEVSVLRFSVIELLRVLVFFLLLTLITLYTRFDVMSWFVKKQKLI